ncbi:MAG: hypothetical protein IJO43_01025 [Bacilli bacterium]|nr:hypothetical protein [Bacilli bacterium]
MSYGFNQTNNHRLLEERSDSSKMQLFGFIGALIMIVGCFLNFATFSIQYEGVNFFSIPANFFMNDGEIQDGMYVVALGISIIMFVFKKKPVNALIAAIVSLGIVLIDCKSCYERIAEFSAQYGGNGVDVVVALGPAFFLCLIGAIIVIIYFVLCYMAAAKLNKQLNSSNTNFNQGQSNSISNNYSNNNDQQNGYPTNFNQNNQPTQYYNNNF